MKSGFSRRPKRPDGILRSRELKDLAKPLAVLLAVLFTLTVHINAALAAGGDTSICEASRAFNNVDAIDTDAQTQIEHCGLCLISGQYKSFGIAAEDGARLSGTGSQIVETAFFAGIIYDRRDQHGIRAPPLS